MSIFASGEMLSNFTADLTQIHNALFKLRSIPMSQSRSDDCPHLSDYQALEITQSVNTNTEAWILAFDEAASCPGALPGPRPSTDSSPRPGSNPLADQVLVQARRIVGETHVLAAANLQGLEHEVNYLARMPGQRTLILVSSGFLSQTEQHDVDRIIDRALRSQVVISSLDSRGLAVLLREGDATQARPSGHTMDSKREFAARQVLAEVAYGTGGEFFHNDNDLKGGFARLADSPVSYILAFAPSHVKSNGQFHTIKVTLANKAKSVTIQARRGYFAPAKATNAKNAAQPPASNATLQTPQQTPSAGPQAQAAEPTHGTAASKTELQQLPTTANATLPPPVASPVSPAPKVADVPKTSANQTYVDYPWQKLRSIVPALKGLKPASDQRNLSAIMEKVGQFIASSTQKIPDLISREDTHYLETDISGHTDIVNSPFSKPQQLQLPRSTHCNYLILFNRDASGAAHVEEYRSDVTQENGIVDKNRSVHGFGFANQWLLFSPANQPDFRFRYLGEQKNGGRETYVIAFAQIPEQTKTPGELSSGGLSVPFFYQGVMWVDQSTYAIVSIRTDLQAPLHSIHLQQLTTEMHFHPVSIKKIDGELWLPQEVQITASQEDHLFAERHLYSNYHLYRTQSRIMLTP